MTRRWRRLEVGVISSVVFEAKTCDVMPAAAAEAATTKMHAELPCVGDVMDSLYLRRRVQTTTIILRFDCSLTALILILILTTFLVRPLMRYDHSTTYVTTGL